jgi:hypothetical protein
MGGNAAKPTITVRLNGDFFGGDDVSVIRKRLDPQFRVDNTSGIYWSDFQVEPAVYVYAAINIVISSPAVRDVLLNLASSGLYDALKYIVTVSNAKREEWATRTKWANKTELRYRISIRDESQHKVFEMQANTNDDEDLKQILQQASEAIRRVFDD